MRVLELLKKAQAFVQLTCVNSNNLKIIIKITVGVPTNFANFISREELESNTPLRSVLVLMQDLSRKDLKKSDKP
jgi:hypothetical protein